MDLNKTFYSEKKTFSGFSSSAIYYHVIQIKWCADLFLKDPPFKILRAPFTEIPFKSSADQLLSDILGKIYYF